jgi:KDO2-lipid IV(A) lauroyltransferase
LAVSPVPAQIYLGLLDRALPRLRRVAMRNLELALPELGVGRHREIADGSFRSLARMLATLGRFPRLNKQNIGELIGYEGFEHFEAVKARGRGVLFATAHLGNWELSAYAHALMAEPMHVIVRPLDNRRVDDIIERLRAGSGNTIYSKRDFLRPVLKALARNEAVGILVDQNVGLNEGIFVDFFGRKACVSPSFMKLAAHSGAGVIPGFALWDEGRRRYVLKFHEPLYPSGDVVNDTRLVHARLEEVIRAYPDQWLWMHRRWKTRPEGEPGLY